MAQRYNVTISEWTALPDRRNSKFIGGTRMKKLFALALSAIMVLGLLSGCGSKEEPPAEGG